MSASSNRSLNSNRTVKCTEDVYDLNCCVICQERIVAQNELLKEFLERIQSRKQEVGTVDVIVVCNSSGSTGVGDVLIYKFTASDVLVYKIILKSSGILMHRL